MSKKKEKRKPLYEREEEIEFEEAFSKGEWEEHIKLVEEETAQVVKKAKKVKKL